MKQGNFFKGASEQESTSKIHIRIRSSGKFVESLYKSNTAGQVTIIANIIKMFSSLDDYLWVFDNDPDPVRADLGVPSSSSIEAVGKSRFISTYMCSCNKFFGISSGKSRSNSKLK
jgi:hypothetical protein